MDFNNLTFGNGLLLSAFSVLVVFLVLLSISYLADVTAFFTNFKARRRKEEASGGELPPDLPPASGLVEEGLDTRTGAIIMAALSAYRGSAQGFRIRRTDRLMAPLSAWEAQGLRDLLQQPADRRE